MMKDIKLNGVMVTLGSETAAQNDLFIHCSDYGDNYLDLTICYKKDERMFGDTALCGIPRNKIEKYILDLKKATGITDIRKVKIDQDDMYY